MHIVAPSSLEFVIIVIAPRMFLSTWLMYVRIVRHRVLRPMLWRAVHRYRSIRKHSTLPPTISLATSNLASTLSLLTGGQQRDIKYPLHALLGIAMNQHTIRADIAHADHAQKKEFTLLSATPHRFGENFEWHTDFNTGYTWQMTPSHDPQHFVYPRGTDIKTVWELGRCHHLLWLALGYESTGSETYAEQIINDITHCLHHNPVGMGVQWTMPMEIAIRAINIMFSMIAIAPALPRLLPQKKFHAIIAWLYAHVEYVFAHQEYTRRPNNHLLSNGVGLFVLGSFFATLFALPEWQSYRSVALRWQNEGASIIEKAMREQVYSDGGNYEKSTAYHTLVLEMFALTHIIGKNIGWEFSSLYHNRLHSMHHLFIALLRENTTIPHIGDADNGRILRIVPTESANDMHALKNFLHTALTNPVMIEPIVMPLENFSETGLVIHHTTAHYFLIDVGDYGMNGWGGHGHNDCLSFVWDILGETIITDSGCGSYTGNTQLRRYQRSTRAHNTVAIAELEQCDFLNLWRITDDTTQPLICSLHANESTLNCSVQHHGYVARTGITHRRTFVLSHTQDNLSGELLLSDELERVSQAPDNTFANTPSWGYLHIAPEVNIDVIDQYAVGFTAQRSKGIIWCSSPISISLAPYSTHYGDTQSQCTKLTYKAPAFVRITWETYQKPPTIFSGYGASA